MLWSVLYRQDAHLGVCANIDQALRAPERQHSYLSIPCDHCLQHLVLLTGSPEAVSSREQGRFPVLGFEYR